MDITPVDRRSKKDKPLTPEQSTFCEVYANTGNAAQAYRTAYNRKLEDGAVCRVRAHELLSSPRIQATVELFRQNSAEFEGPTKWIHEEGLNYRQAMFVAEYVIDFDAKRAAIAVGFSPKWASGNAKHLIDKPHVAAAIKRALDAKAKRAAITADRVLSVLHDMAFYNPQDIYDEEGMCRHIMDLPEDIRNSIVQFGPDGKPTKMVNRFEILSMLAKHLKLLDSDNVNVNIQNNQNTVNYDNLSEAELLQLQELMEKAESNSRD